MIIKNTSILYFFLKYLLSVSLLILFFNSFSFASVFNDNNCKALKEPKNSNGYLFDKYCTVAFLHAPKVLKAQFRYDKEQVLDVCSKFSTKVSNHQEGLKRIKIHTVYYFDYQDLIKEFQNLNKNSGIFFQRLPYSFSVAAIPRYETAMNLGEFPISVTSLKNTERVIRTYYNNRESLSNIDLDLDRYSLLPFNNIIQNTWTLDTQSTCQNYYDLEKNIFDWDNFELNRLAQLTPVVTNEYAYSKLNKNNRIEFVKEISISYYRKDGSN